MQKPATPKETKKSKHTKNISKGKFQDISEMFNKAKTNQQISSTIPDTNIESNNNDTNNNSKDNKKQNNTLKQKSSVINNEEEQAKILPKKTKAKQNKPTTSNRNSHDSSKKKKIIDDDSSESISNCSNANLKPHVPITRQKAKQNNKKGKQNKKELDNSLSDLMDIDDDSLMDSISLNEKTPNKKKRNKKERNTTTNKKSTSHKNATNEIIGPLTDNTIVLTGEFPISRETFTNTLKSLGAKVTGSVSSRTTILIHGDKLEDGRSYEEGNKYKKAKANGSTKIYSYYQFETYMKELLNDSSWTIETSCDRSEIKPDLGKVNNNTEQSNVNINNTNINDINKEQLWSTKYQPKALNDIIGNAKNINNFIQWLDDWDDVVLNGNKKKTTTHFKGRTPHFDNINARACLITGDPGIGKTSSVRLIAKLKGYHTYETNASEQRNKSSINSRVGFLFDNTTLFIGNIATKNLIIMDEVDGMGGNEDRGGIAALIDVIKKTKVPIVCIANDRQSQKLKSLVNYCYDIRFTKPDKRQISQRLMKICELEGIQCEMNALEFLCESVGNDIRQCLNFVEMWAKTHNKIKFSEIQQRYNTLNKDALCMISNFEAGSKLLNSTNAKKYSFRELLDLYFIDYDLIPLLIHENYLSCFYYENKYESLTNCAFASDLISESDVVDKRIHSKQDWSLLADKGILSAVGVCSSIKGSVGFAKFPELFGKLSSLKKTQREISEVRKCFGSCDRKGVRDEIVNIIMLLFSGFLNEGEIDKCLEMIRKYKLSLELVKENIMDLCEERYQALFEKVGTSMKSSLTREYNKNFKTSVVKKRGKNRNDGGTSGGDGAKYDKEGNLLYEEQGDNGNSEGDESGNEENEVVLNTKGRGNKTKVTKKTQKAKTKNKNKN